MKFFSNSAANFCFCFSRSATFDHSRRFSMPPKKKVSPSVTTAKDAEPPAKKKGLSRTE